MKKKSLSKKENDLLRRYLIWCYKTTKEDLDRIDRYFTQEVADNVILAELRKKQKSKSIENKYEFEKLVNDFENYMAKKIGKAKEKKYIYAKSQRLNPEYEYLEKRFSAIEKAIVHLLGEKGLKDINKLYENEMTERILKAREHT